MNRAIWLTFLGTAMAVGCTPKKAPQESPATNADPTAGRSRVAIFYSGNMWGDLLECG